MGRRVSRWYMDLLKAVGLYVLIEAFAVVWEHGFRAPLGEVKDAIRYTTAMFLVVRYGSTRSAANPPRFGYFVLWGLVAGAAVSLVNAGLDHLFFK